MSIDSWQPTPVPNSIDSEHISRLLSCASDFQNDENFTPELDWIQPFTKVELSIWQNAVKSLNDDQLIQLIKLFTCLEKHHNWDLADKSPVIAIFKTYKKKSGLNRELVQWVKANTDNKYLPFGPLL